MHAPSRRTRCLASGAAGLLALVALTPVSAAAAPSAVRVGWAAPARPLPPAFFGLNGADVQGPSWADPRLQDALRSLSPDTLRYPGGTVANYWDWRRGWFQPGDHRWPGQQSWPRVDATIPAFAAAVERTGAQPIFVLNMMTVDGRLATAADTPAMIADQLAMLRAAQAQGLTVRRVELGNEFYLTGGELGPDEDDYARRFSGAEDYARQMTVWTDAVHQAFPQAQVALVGASPIGPHIPPRWLSWTDGVLRTQQRADALSFHEYLRIGSATATPSHVFAAADGRYRALEEAVAPLGPQGLRAWVTEFNLNDLTRDLVLAGTWEHGLAVTSMALLLASNPLVDLAGLTNAVGDAHAGAVFSGTSGFPDGPATVPLARTASGTAFGILSRAADGATSARTLAFPGVPTVANGSPAVLGQLFDRSGSPAVVLLDLAATPVTLDLSGVLPGATTWRTTTATDLHARIAGPGGVTTRRGTSSGTLTLAPYSLTVVSQGAGPTRR